MDSRLREALTTAGLIYFGFCLGEKVNRVRKPFAERAHDTLDTLEDKIDSSTKTLEKYNEARENRFNQSNDNTKEND